MSVCRVSFATHDIRLGTNVIEMHTRRRQSASLKLQGPRAEDASICRARTVHLQGSEPTFHASDFSLRKRPVTFLPLRLILDAPDQTRKRRLETMRAAFAGTPAHCSS